MRMAHAFLVNLFDVSEQIAILRERRTTNSTWSRSNSLMNRTDVPVAIAGFTKRLSALSTVVTTLALVHSANVAIQITLEAEFLVTSLAFVIVCFVRIVNAVDVLTKGVVLGESPQTNRALRSILSIVNRFLAQRRRHQLKGELKIQSAKAPTHPLMSVLNSNAYLLCEV